MTLGRTPGGAIKIQTAGEKGLRAVECGCCDCYCVPILPPPGSLFFKEKIAGNHVDRFTRVAISYNIVIVFEGIDKDLNPDQIAAEGAGTYTTAWIDAPEDYLVVKKMMDPSGCDDAFGGICTLFSESVWGGIISLSVAYTQSGCLYLYLWEGSTGQGFQAVRDPCPADGTGLITVNGAQYPTQIIDSFGYKITGSLAVTFT